MKIALSLSTAVFLAAAPALADDSVPVDTAADTRTLEQQIPVSVTNTAQDNILTLNVENDLFTGGDSNYTSGVRLSYYDMSSTLPGFARYLGDALPGFDINNTTSLFYSMGQNIFTPEDIEVRPQTQGEHPWSGFLYASMGMATLSDNHIDQVEATLGVVGPAALGEQTQKFIHRHLSNSPMPKGWSNQLENEPGIMLAWERTWPEFWAGDFAGLYGSVAPYTGATIGNIYTFADAGFSFRLGPDTERWQDAPIRVRPAMPGTGFFEIPQDDWSWYLFAGLEGRAVARNIFLDGNTFQDSYSVDKEILVGDANAGLALTYGRTRVSFTWVYRTKEFETQDKPESFGSIAIGYRF